MNKSPPPMQAIAPPRDPALDAIKAQAETDKLDAITQRVSQRTQDLMLRFGARTALSGASVASPLTGGVG